MKTSSTRYVLTSLVEALRDYGPPKSLSISDTSFQRARATPFVKALQKHKDYASFRPRQSFDVLAKGEWKGHRITVIGGVESEPLTNTITKQPSKEGKLESKTQLVPVERPSYISEDEWQRYLADEAWFERQKRQNLLPADYMDKWVVVYQERVVACDADLDNILSDLDGLVSRVDPAYEAGTSVYIGKWTEKPITTLNISAL